MKSGRGKEVIKILFLLLRRSLIIRFGREESLGVEENGFQELKA